MTTPDTLPDVDTELLGRLLRDVERSIHDRGWDNPGLYLYIIYDNRIDETDQAMRDAMASNPRIGPGMRLGPYTAQLMMVPIFFAMLPISGDKALRNFAMNVAYTTDEDVTTTGLDIANPMTSLRSTIQRPGVLAFASAYEGWLRLGSKEDIDPIRDKDWADVPGSKEIRCLMCVDIHSRGYLVDRVRGSNAELNNSEARGSLMLSLRLLMDSVAGRTPPIEDFCKRYHGE